MTSFHKIYKFCPSTGWCTIFTILINHQGGILSVDIYAQKPLYCPIGLNECIKIRWKRGMVSVELSIVLSIGNREIFPGPGFYIVVWWYKPGTQRRKLQQQKMCFICEEKLNYLFMRIPGIVIITVGMLQKQNDINSHINSHKGYTFSFSSQRPVLRDTITPKE